MKRASIKHILLSMASMLISVFFCALAASCSGHSAFENSMAISDEAKQKMFKEPTEVLSPTTSETTANDYSVYQLVEAKFGVDAQHSSISARVTVVSNAGTEVVDLVGTLRIDGTASLVDTHPLNNSQNRLVAEALCVGASCKKIILNVYYNIAGKTHKRQFSSDELRAGDAATPPAQASTPQPQAPTSSTATAPAAQPQATSPADTDDTQDGEEVHPSEKKLSKTLDESDVKLGDYVGPTRNETLVKQLWPRSQTPELPPELGTLDPSAPAKPTTVPNQPAASPSSPTKAAPAKPAAPPSKPTAPQPVPPVTQPDPTKPKVQPVPATAPQDREEKPKPAAPAHPTDGAATSTDATVYPFPPAKPISTDAALDQKVTQLEARLAPLMNLRDGGVSQGAYANSLDPDVKSTIINASLLPSNIPGLVPMTINRNAHYGSGMLISFLENAATYLFKQLGLKLYVGDISYKNGGSYGKSSSHNTHQNGLDADIAWLGIAHPLHDSALTSNGNMVAGFDFEKTWTFLRLANKQEIIEDAQKQTAISRVFMSPAVKAGFCAWAKKTGRLDNDEDSELMRLVRPVAGHYKHFHLSLKCSPHYPLCRNLAGPPPPGSGC